MQTYWVSCDREDHKLYIKGVAGWKEEGCWEGELGNQWMYFAQPCPIQEITIA